MPYDPDVKALMHYVKKTGLYPIRKMGVEKARRELNGVTNWDVPREEVYRRKQLEISDLDVSVQVRIYWPNAAKRNDKLPCLLMFHGGGFVLGDLNTYENSARHYCNMAGIVVLNVSYRLAPEHKFPIAVEDSYAALKWVSDNADELGVDPNRIALTGASSGGMLVIVLCLLARERNGPKIALQIPVIPVLSLTQGCLYPSRSKFTEDMEDLLWFIDMYLETPCDKRDARLSPILVENYTGLPSALVITAGHCPVRDEGKLYADRLRAAGVAVDYECYEGANHQAMVLPGMIKTARQAVDKIVGTLIAQL